MKKNKRGQFYLITALVVISLAAGYVAVSNHYEKGGSTTIYDLGEELQLESVQVTGYGIYTGSDTQQLFEDFARSYSEYAGDGRDLYFVFGNKDDFAVSAYQDLESGEILVYPGGITGYSIAVNKKSFIKRDFPGGTPGDVSIKVQDSQYDFELDENEYFYFVISEEVSGEKYITTNSKPKNKSKDN